MENKQYSVAEKIQYYRDKIVVTVSALTEVTFEGQVMNLNTIEMLASRVKFYAGRVKSLEEKLKASGAQ